MQPHYLPWSGYFNLIARSDVFVLLDDVQFEKQSWQSRNRILLNGVPHFLSVPVRHAGLGTSIAAVEVNQAQDWAAAHLRSLEHAYAKAPYGRDVIDQVGPVLEDPPALLADLTVAIIRTISQRLDLKARMFRASDIGCGGRRSEHVAAICRAVGATHYLSPGGSREYMEHDGFEALAGIPATYQHFEPRAYPQRGSEDFVSHLSVVDVVAHLGWDGAAAYVRQPDSEER